MRKFLTILLLLATMFPFAAKADQLTVNDGTATNQFIPIYGYYADMTSYAEVQFIIPKEGLTSMTNTVISGLTFYANYNHDFGNAKWNVYIEETSYTTLSSAISHAGSTPAYSGNMAIASGQLVVTFDNQYSYGGENLLISFTKTQSGTYSSSSADKFYGVTASNGASGYVHSGSTFTQQAFLPKVTFDYAPAPVSFSVTPTNFGPRPNGAWMEPVTVEVGGGAYNVTAMNIDNDYFTFDGPGVPFTTPATFAVTTGNAASGDVTGHVAFFYEDSRGNARFDLNATAYDPTEGDVVEKAIIVPAGLGAYTDTPSGIYHNYNLPGEDSNDPDAVYRLNFYNLTKDVLLMADFGGDAGKMALYKEEADGTCHPMSDNAYEYAGMYGGKTLDGEGMYVEKGGKYYLVAQAADGFTVNINASEAPVPGTPEVTYPANEGSMPANDARAEWTLGEFTTQIKVSLGTNTPTDPVVSWTTILDWTPCITETGILNNMQLQGLADGTSYFLKVEAKNAVGEVSSEKVFFKTTTSAPENLSANSTEIFEGDNVTFTWEHTTASQLFVGYNIYNGETKMNESVITQKSFEYTFGEESRNMDGYSITVKAAFSNGTESEASTPVTVKVAGYATKVTATVADQDEVTMLQGVAVTLEGEDVFGNSVAYNGTTDANGLCEFKEADGSASKIREGLYTLTAEHADFETIYVEEILIGYMDDNNIPVVMHEKYYAPSTVTAREIDDNKVVKVEWDMNRSLQNFKIWLRKTAGEGIDPGTPNVDLVEEDYNAVSSTWYDNAWEGRDRGVYQYGVQAIYAGNQNPTRETSEETWSNTLEKDMNTESFTFKISTDDEQSVAGAQVTMTNLSEPESKITYEFEMGVTGEYQIANFRRGVYNIEVVPAEGDDHDALTEENVYLWDAKEYEVILNETQLEVKNIYVSHTGYARWDKPTVKDRGFLYYKLSVDDVVVEEYFADTCYQINCDEFEIGGSYKFTVAVAQNTMENETDVMFDYSGCSAYDPSSDPMYHSPEAAAECNNVVVTWGFEGATIILTADNVWGDGSGYQMLLDNTHSLYGTTIPAEGALSMNCSGNEGIYNQFSHKIPVNADGNCSTLNMVCGNSVSITIPAGTYDWCITNPTPDDRIYIAGARGTIGGRYDDFTFDAGCTYEFHVYHHNSGNDATDLTINGGRSVQPKMAVESSDCKNISDVVVLNPGNRGLNDIELSKGSEEWMINTWALYLDGEFLEYVSGNTRRYEMTIEDSEEHTFKVVGIDNEYNMSCGEEVTFKAGVTTMPSNLFAETVDEGVRFSWEGNSSEYIIYKGFTTDNMISLGTVEDGATEFVDGEVMPGCLYGVSGLSGCGESEMATVEFGVLEDPHYTPEKPYFSATMDVTGYVAINNVDPLDSNLEIGAFITDIYGVRHCCGSARSIYAPSENHNIFQFKVYGDTENDVITFELYDHGTGEVLDLVSKSTLNFKVGGSEGTIAEPFAFKFISTETHEVALNGIGNWISTYIELSGEEGLDIIKAGLGENAEEIKVDNQFTTYVEGYGWFGNLETAGSENMFIIRMSQYAVADFTGMVADPADHPITIHKNWNRIGYISNVAMDLNTALGTLNPAEGDVIKSKVASAEYVGGYGWFGGLETMEPGKGYMYFSNSAEPQTLVYPAAAPSRVENAAGNATSADSHWTVEPNRFAMNMSVTAAVTVDGSLVENGDIEVGAFCNGEVRGSARPVYVEALDRYVIFLTVFGNEGDNISFRLFNAEDGSEYTAAEHLVYSDDAIKGGIKDPFMLNFGDDNISVFPNPTKGNVIVSADGMKNISVVNTLGQTVYRQETNAGEMTIDMSQFGAGMYLISIETENGTTVKRVNVTR